MAKSVKDSFLDLEKHRQLLEENIEKLRKSLLHWQIWEAEYEALKEEIITVGPEPSHEQLVAICQDFAGALITQAEAEEITGINVSRTSDQITNILSRRIDYVTQNVKTLSKQLDAAENKLMAATVISNPDVRNEEGLPLTDIIEELDEDGNVISGRIETQGNAKKQLQEVLEKAGIKDSSKTEQKPTFEELTSEMSDQGRESKNEVSADKVAPEMLGKLVRFSDDKDEVQEIHKPEIEQPRTAIADSIKRNNSMIGDPPVIPVDESPEDSALRKEMLQYSMSEIGAVVAELDLEDGSDFTDDDGDQYADFDGSSTEDEEDKFGRSTKKVVDEQMRQRMKELEEKLGFRAMANVGPNPTMGLDCDSDSQLLNVMGAGEELQEGNGKKSVRFAEKLDIAQPPSATTSPELKTEASMKAPILDIIERPPNNEEPEHAPNSAKKISRFRSARIAKDSSHHPDQPSHSQTSSPSAKPASKPLLDTIIEREILVTAPPEPDELHQALLHQEVATEYHRARNRMIQKQGGFMKDWDLEEKGIIPFTEEEGGPKKMSRFKAARLVKD